jgi:hypothetical protein
MDRAVPRGQPLAGGRRGTLGSGKLGLQPGVEATLDALTRARTYCWPAPTRYCPSTFVLSAQEDDQLQRRHLARSASSDDARVRFGRWLPQLDCGHAPRLTADDSRRMTGARQVLC